MENLKKWNKIAVIFVAAVFLFLLLPPVFSNGMFLDGIVYATISRNLAEGLGSFWQLHYTSLLYPVFYEHPPLSFFIQSQFFKILGDTIYTERIFTFLTAVANLYLIALIWKTVFKNSDKKTFWWIPVLFFFITPVVFWSFGNNMIENTLTIFTLTSFVFAFRAVNSKGKQAFVFSLIAGLSASAAFFTKGPVGLFPLAFPLITGLFKYNVRPKRIIINSLVILIPGIVIIGLLLYINPSSAAFFKNYFDVQVIKSIQGGREITEEGRFYIITRLFSELLPLIGIAVLIFIISFKKNIRLFRENRKNRSYLFLFLSIGLSACLPLMLSPKQHGYYLVPALPFFALAFSIIVFPIIYRTFKQKPIGKSTFGILQIIFYIILAASVMLSVMQIGKYRRDEALLNDIEKIRTIVPENTSIAIPKEAYEDWTLHAYMMRNSKISLNCDDKNLEYFLTKKDLSSDVPIGYHKAALKLEKLELYKK